MLDGRRGGPGTGGGHRTYSHRRCMRNRCPSSGWRYSRARAPVTLGHEGIGEILGLGEGVETDCAGVAVHPGDKVYFSPSNVRTTADRTSAWPPPADRPSLAAYQDYATLPPGNAFHRIPDDTDPEAVIAFGCAMPTALGGMARLGGVRPGQTVVIQGCGPVGLAVTVLASLALARQVIVIGEPPHRLEAAETLGATTTIRLTTTSVPERRAAPVRAD